MTTYYERIGDYVFSMPYHIGHYIKTGKKTVKNFNYNFCSGNCYTDNCVYIVLNNYRQLNPSNTLHCDGRNSQYEKCIKCENYINLDDKAEHILNSKVYCDTCFDSETTRCDNCEDLVFFSTCHSDDNGDGCYCCLDCVPECSSEDDDEDSWHEGRIKEYGTPYEIKPVLSRYIKENFDDFTTSTRRLNAIHNNYPNEIMAGIELELNFKRDSFDNIYSTAKAHVKGLFMQDSSLDSGGAELITQPYTKDAFKKVNWKKLLGELTRNGARSYETGECGIHVHIDRKPLLKAYRGNSYLYENVLLHIVHEHKAMLTKFSKREGESIERWARFSDDITHNYRLDSKYCALNIQKDNTLEFRIFRGTCDYKRFHATYLFIFALIDYAIATSKTLTSSYSLKQFILDTPEYRVLKNFLEEKKLLDLMPDKRHREYLKHGIGEILKPKPKPKLILKYQQVELNQEVRTDAYGHVYTANITNLSI